MPRIRLSASASVVPTSAGIQLRSDLRTFQIDGSDIQLFIAEILPLLDGSHDKDGVAAALKGHSRRSVLAFLETLEKHRLLEIVPDELAASPDEGPWRGQQDFFRKWTNRPEKMSRRLNEARVLIVGLEPWGVRAATELAAAGVGRLQLLDDGSLALGDLPSSRTWAGRHLGQARSMALAEELLATYPWSRVTANPLLLTEDRSLAFNDTDWDLVICATTADDLLVLQSVARFTHGARLPSLSGCLENIYAKVGPLVIPGETACWNCCRLRELANSAQPEADQALQDALLSQRPKPRRRTYLGPMPNALGTLLSLESLKLLTGYVPTTLAGSLLVQNLVTLKTSFHRVIRVPWCEVCGGANDGRVLRDSVIMRGEGFHVSDASRTKSFDAVQEPNELRDLLAGWVDERTGIIRYLTSEAPDALKLKLAWTSVAIMSSSTEPTDGGSHKNTGFGAGLSATEAMVSAAAEAIELYAASRHSQSDLFHSSLNDLTEDFLDPRQLCLYDHAQYNKRGFPYARFGPDIPIAWTQGKWLDTGALVWLPALPTYFGIDVPPEEDFCQVTTSGLAAGTSVEDASLRAVFELVERDAFMITWLCQLPARRLVPDAILEDGIRGIIREFEARGMEVRLYVLNVGIPIPTVLCLVLGDGKNWPGATVALGAHASPRVATRRAVLEQGLVGPSIRREMFGGKRTIPKRPKAVSGPMDHAMYYVPKERASAFDFLECGHNALLPLAELEEPKTISLRNCIALLRKAGLRVAIKDLTPPDVVSASPFRVVRALGTLMQPIHFGFDRARLANPRLKAMTKNPLNSNPHPLA